MSWKTISCLLDVISRQVSRLRLTQMDLTDADIALDYGGYLGVIGLGRISRGY